MIGCEDNSLDPADENVVSGIVKDDQGMSVEEAVVTAYAQGIVYHKDTTNENGEFVLKGLPPSPEKVRVSVVHPSFSVIDEELLKVKQQIVENKVQLRLNNDSCCGRIVIKVNKSGTNTPIHGAEVRLNKGHDKYKKIYTNADGFAIFDHVCEGQYWVRIAKEGYQVIEEDMQMPDCDTLEYTFNMLSKNNQNDSCCHGIFAITIKDSTSNQPISNVVVKLWLNGKVLDDYKTDASGKVVFRELCEGQYGISYTKENFTSGEMSFNLTCNDSIGVVKYIKEICCNGIAIVSIKDSTTQQPVKDAIIKLWKGNKVIKEVKTDNTGRFMFRELCEGNYSVSYGFQNKMHEFGFTIHCNDTLEFVKYVKQICCNGIAIVSIKDSTNNQPVKDALIKLWKDGKVIKEVITDNTGRYVFRELCEGQYGVSYGLKNSKMYEFGFTIECNDTLEFVKKIGTNCCHGKLIVKTRENGQYVDGAWVKLIQNGTIYRSGQTQGGQVGFDGICEGTYTLYIKKDGYKPQEYSITINCQDSLVLEKQMVKETNNQDTCCHGKIRLYVKDSTNIYLKNAKVKLWKGNVLVAEKYTNDNGYVAFEEVCKGQYQLSIIREGYKGMEFSFTMDCNEIKEATKILTKDVCCTGKIKFKLVDKTTLTAIQGATVKIWKHGQILATATSNVEGWVVFENLCAPVEYGFDFEAQGYKHKELSLKLSECKTVQETIKLEQ